MQPMYYIGLDVHKRKISYCVKDNSGKVFAEGSLPATRLGLDLWMKTLPQPWSAAMEATMFTGWIYDHLKPHAAALKVAHPLMLRAIAAAKKKNDRMDAGKICDCLRCDFLPESYMASTAIRERRRTLRYRNLLVRQMVQMKIKTSALLMEAGVSYQHRCLARGGEPGGFLRRVACQVLPLTRLTPPRYAFQDRWAPALQACSGRRSRGFCSWAVHQGCHSAPSSSGRPCLRRDSAPESLFSAFSQASSTASVVI